MRDAVSTAVDLILETIQNSVGDDGLYCSFFFQKPGTPTWQPKSGVEIYLSHRKLIDAAVFIRQNGSEHLRSLPLSDVERKISAFITDNYYYISTDEILFSHIYGELQKTQVNKDELKKALLSSDLFSPRHKLTLYPLVAVEVHASYSADTFFLRQPDDLLNEFDESDHKWISPSTFPPDPNWKYRKETPVSWLGVRSPSEEYSNKVKAQILASLALTQPTTYRHQFSGREMFGGRATIDGGGISITFRDPDTPPLYNDIQLREIDKKWLDILKTKLTSSDIKDKRMLKALEYYYRAWFLNPSERFPWHCMTLDALFGHANHATHSVVEGIRDLLGTHIKTERLRDLLELRASIIHGGAPDVYESRKYGKYWRKYRFDPIRDLDLLLESSLRKMVFLDCLEEHPDPHAAIINEMVAKGRIAPRSASRSVLASSSDE